MREPLRLRPIRWNLLERCIWLVRGDTVGMNEITWKNRTRSGSQSGAGANQDHPGSSDRCPHNHLSNNNSFNKLTIRYNVFSPSVLTNILS